MGAQRWRASSTDKVQSGFVLGTWCIHEHCLRFVYAEHKTMLENVFSACNTELWMRCMSIFHFSFCHRHTVSSRQQAAGVNCLACSYIVPRPQQTEMLQPQRNKRGKYVEHTKKATLPAAGTTTTTIKYKQKYTRAQCAFIMREIHTHAHKHTRMDIDVGW